MNGPNNKIGWCDRTWNPVVGCTNNCEGCYAARQAMRFYQKSGVVKDGKWTGKIAYFDERLDRPAVIKKPQRIFVCSMGDLFCNAVDSAFIQHVLDKTEQCPQHTFIFCTQNQGRYREFVWPPNCWLLTTVRNQPEADERIPLLLQNKATVLGISIEPMLESIKLYPDYLPIYAHSGPPCGLTKEDYHRTNHPCYINWIILGGQTGANAKPMHPNWVRNIRDQAKAAGVPLFFKGWGEYAPCSQFEGIKKPGRVISLDGQDAGQMCRCGKKKAGCLIDGVEYKEFPENRNPETQLSVTRRL